MPPKHSSVDQRRRAGDRDRLLQLAHLQREVELEDLLGADADTGTLEVLKPVSATLTVYVAGSTFSNA